MTRPFLLPLLLALVLALPQPAAAQVGPLLPLADLGARSALVVTGRVADVRGAWVPAERTIYTYVTIDVLETLKGRATTRLVVKQLGGTTPALGLRIEDQAAFVPGQDVLLFLEVSPRDGTVRTVALGQGQWTLLTDLASGGTTALRGGSTTGTAVPLADVRAAVAASGEPAAYVAVPPETGSVLAGNAVAADYAYLPTGGNPARWHEVDDGSTIPVDTGSLSGLGGGLAEVDAAIALWSNAGSSLRLGRSGSFGGCAAEFTGNGRIRVGSDAQCGQAGSWVLAGGYFTPGDLRVVGGVTFQKFVQGFVVIDDAAGPQVTSSGCFQDAVTHGLGHAIGLGHTGGDAIMNADPPSGCTGGPRGLGGDDVDAVRDIYRAQPGGGEVPRAPTAVTATVVGNTVTITWTPATTGGTPQSYLLEAGTAPGLANIVVIPVPGTGTSVVVGDVPQGVYWIRVRARNALGTSAGASPDAQVIVGTCDVPGPPQVFTATGSDTLASFTWAPPATGGAVQRYQLEAGTAPGLANVLVLPLPATPSSFQAHGPYGTYYVRLRAANSCGVSAATGDLVLTLQPCTAPPTAPASLQATVSPQRVVTLTWTPPAAGPAPSDYVVYVGSAPGAADILIYGTGSAAPSLVASAPPRTYYVRVAARNACGQSGTTNEQTIVVP